MKSKKISVFKNQAVLTVDVSENLNIWGAASSGGEIFFKKCGKIAKRHFTKLKNFNAVLQIRFYGQFKNQYCVVLTRHRAFILRLNDLALSFDIKSMEIYPQQIQNINSMHILKDNIASINPEKQHPDEDPTLEKHILVIADQTKVHLIAL
jgi:hypothetical protein